MKYLIILLPLLAHAYYPKFQYNDKVKLTSAHNTIGYFYKCKKVGKVVEFAPMMSGKLKSISCKSPYVYKVHFKCPEFEGATNWNVRDEYIWKCGNKLEKVK
jgi:hypothetical protein